MKQKIIILNVNCNVILFREPTSLNSTCNSACGCTTKKFNPICGVNGVTYYSPCHAGCQQEITINDIKVSL